MPGVSQDQEPLDAASGPWGRRDDSGTGEARSDGVTVPAPRGSVPSVAHAAPLPAFGPEPVRFVGDRRPFAAMMLKGFALYIPTFGFNRFWLRTDQRRFYWLHTTLGGDSFEYRGTAQELVVGFLFAVAIYMPIAAAYSLAGLYAETVQAYASLPFFLFTFAFTQYAAFRARRYRLTRTGFRGLRFWMGGTPWALGLGALGWLVLTSITAGIAYPWMQAWIERYKMRNARFGDIPGSFSGTGWGLAKTYIVPGILMFLLLIFGGSSFFGVISGHAGVAVVLGLIVSVLMTCAIAAIWSMLSVAGYRWWVGGIAFGDLRVTTSIASTAMVGPAMRTMLIVYIALGLWFAAGIMLARAILGIGGLDLATTLMSSIALVIPTLLWTTAGLIGASFLKTVFYNYEFVRRIADATTVEGLETLKVASAAGTAESATGEGLADALGADGF